MGTEELQATLEAIVRGGTQAELPVSIGIRQVGEPRILDVPRLKFFSECKHTIGDGPFTSNAGTYSIGSLPPTRPPFPVIEPLVGGGDNAQVFATPFHLQASDCGVSHGPFHVGEMRVPLPYFEAYKEQVCQ